MSSRHDRPSAGVVFTPKSPPERLREVAQAAEAAGFAQLWPGEPEPLIVAWGKRGS